MMDRRLLWDPTRSNLRPTDREKEGESAGRSTRRLGILGKAKPMRCDGAFRRTGTAKEITTSRRFPRLGRSANSLGTLVVEQCEDGQERATQEASMESFPRLKQIVVLRDGSFGRYRTSEGQMSEFGGSCQVPGFPHKVDLQSGTCVQHANSSRGRRRIDVPCAMPR